VTEIGLLRHFPTDWNREARLQGRTDRPIDTEAAEALAGLALPAPWDEADILASPLSRAFVTATTLADTRPVATDARLVEQSWGRWEGARAADLMATPSSGFVPTHRLPETMCPPGGESALDVWDRVHPMLMELGQAGGRVLVVGHKAVMRLLLRRADPTTPDPEIKRARIYPLQCDPSGRLSNPAAPVRLAPRL